MDSKDWYTHCRHAIEAEFGSDSGLFIDLLAATSPRKQVTANWRLAFYIYHKWKGHKPYYEYKGKQDYQWDRWFDSIPGLMRSQYPNVKRALLRQPLSGNKVSAFARALKGDLTSVVIDVWICRWYDFQGTLTDKRYAELVERIKQEAEQCCMATAEYQAMIWMMCRRKYGKTDRSYLHTPDRGQKYFEFYFGGNG